MIIERLSDETRFTATEKKVIEFIQEHPRVVTNLSLDDLAAALFHFAGFHHPAVQKTGHKRLCRVQSPACI